MEDYDATSMHSFKSFRDQGDDDFDEECHQDE